MKLSTAVSVLLTVPALGYTPNTFNFGKPKVTATSSTSLGGYLDSISATTIETPKIDWVAEDDAQTADLKKITGFTEGAIREQYSNWCMKYGKASDEARYTTYKKNFLMQEEYNQKYGSSFSLNGYGDMTEQEYRELKSGVVAAAEPVAVVEEPALVVEEEQVVVQEPKAVVVEESVVIEEEPVIVEAPKAEVEIIDKTDELFVEKYKAIDDAEERAFEVLKDLNLVDPAPQHYSFSYVDETPELRLDAGSNYLDAIHKPDVSALDGSATMTGYLASMTPSDSSTFEEGKSGATLSSHYLDDICGVLEPFMDCNKKRTPIVITSPVEDFVTDRVAQIKNLGDKAFNVLVELCQVGWCDKSSS